MTCVIGMVDDDGRVWMGADSLGTDQWTNGTPFHTPKVFARGRLLISYTGSFRFGNILRHTADMPPADDFGERYLVAEFVPWLRAALVAGGWVETKEGRETGGTALIGGYGLLFRLDNDFAILQTTRGFDTAGSGMDHARGALSVLRGQPERRIRRALRVAADLSTTVGGPFHVLHDGDL